MADIDRMPLPTPSSASPDPAGDAARAYALLAGTGHGRVATSMRALPFLATARHILADGRLLLRMHRGTGYHQACVGSVVAYGADNLGGREPTEGEWSVQLVGLCEAVRPSDGELLLFGPVPGRMDGEPYDPVYLRIEPQFITVHTADPALPGD